LRRRQKDRKEMMMKKREWEERERKGREVMKLL
jgi:hypothetical protein